MSIDDLADRELDAAVAREVLGLPVEAVTNARTGERDYVYASRPGAPDRVRVPSYTASMGASITVEVELQKRGWKRKEWRGGVHWNEPSYARVILEHTDGRTVEASGPVNEALCRAALKGLASGEVL